MAHEMPSTAFCRVREGSIDDLDQLFVAVFGISQLGCELSIPVYLDVCIPPECRLLCTRKKPGIRQISSPC